MHNDIWLMSWMLQQSDLLVHASRDSLQMNPAVSLAPPSNPKVALLWSIYTEYNRKMSSAKALASGKLKSPSNYRTKRSASLTNNRRKSTLVDTFYEYHHITY